MPVGSKVHKVYAALVREGASKGKAARIAQDKAHWALAAGKPPKKKRKTLVSTLVPKLPWKV